MITLPEGLAELVGVPIIGFARDGMIFARAYMLRAELQAFETRLRAVPEFTYTAASRIEVALPPVRLHATLCLHARLHLEVWEVGTTAGPDIDAMRAALARDAAPEVRR